MYTIIKFLNIKTNVLTDEYITESPLSMDQEKKL